jgi:hypothetical protein
MLAIVAISIGAICLAGTVALWTFGLLTLLRGRRGAGR